MRSVSMKTGTSRQAGALGSSVLSCGWMDDLFWLGFGLVAQLIGGGELALAWDLEACMAESIDELALGRGYADNIYLSASVRWSYFEVEGRGERRETVCLSQPK